MLFLHSHTFIHEHYNYKRTATVSQLRSGGQSRQNQSHWKASFRCCSVSFSGERYNWPKRHRTALKRVNCSTSLQNVRLSSACPRSRLAANCLRWPRSCIHMFFYLGRSQKCATTRCQPCRCRPTAARPTADEDFHQNRTEIA